jgi:hypothetical protein
MMSGEICRGAVPALVGRLGDSAELFWLIRPGSQVPDLVDPEEPSRIDVILSRSLSATRPTPDQLAPGGRKWTTVGTEAAKALVRIGAPAAEFCRYCLRDPKSPYRLTAAWQLRYFPGQETVSQLVQAIGDGDHEVRVNAITSLGGLKARDAVMPLAGALAEGRDTDVIADALGEIGDASAVDALLEALEKQKQPGLVAPGLGKIGDARAVPALLAALKRGNRESRALVAHALGQLRDPRAVEALLPLLEDVGYPARSEAAWALGELKDLRAVAPLISALKKHKKSWGGGDWDAWPATVRSSAAAALTKLTGQTFGEDYKEWAAWWEQSRTSPGT